MFINDSGYLVYESGDHRLTSLFDIRDEQWHNVSLTHYHAQGQTQLYVDGEQVLESVSEKMTVDHVQFESKGASEEDKLRQVLFYRAGMNDKEIRALSQGEILQSSLEVYLPLDNKYTNLAQTL